MREALEASKPRELKCGQWHLPYYDDEDGLAFNDRDPGALPQTDLVRASVGRCARVSYLTHDGKRDLDADIALHDRLLTSGHLSPFEHVARPATYEDWHTRYDELVSSDVGNPVLYAPQLEVVDFGDGPYARLAPEHQWHGNFRGWVQYRKLIPNEADILGGADARR